MRHLWRHPGIWLSSGENVGTYSTYNVTLAGLRFIDSIKSFILTSESCSWFTGRIFYKGAVDRSITTLLILSWQIKYFCHILSDRELETFLKKWLSIRRYAYAFWVFDFFFSRRPLELLKPQIRLQYAYTHRNSQGALKTKLSFFFLIFKWI